MAEAIRLFSTKDEALNFLIEQSNETQNIMNAASVGDGNASSSENSAGGNAAEEGPSKSKQVKRDEEMEDELTLGLQKADAFDDYDNDVTKEGEAITEYLALVNSIPNAT